MTSQTHHNGFWATGLGRPWDVIAAALSAGCLDAVGIMARCIVLERSVRGGQSMRTLVAETLAAWRQAERVLEQSEVGSTDHETAQMAVTELRDLYQRLTERTGLDPAAGEPPDEPGGREALTRIRADLGIETQKG